MKTTSQSGTAYELAIRAALGPFTSGLTRDIELQDAVGCVLAEAVCADRDLPPFNRAMLDGYAVRAADIAPGCALPVAAEIHAGHTLAHPVPEGACVAIATGAAVPPPFNAVIPHEQSDRGNPVSFTIDAVEPGSAVHARGADARQSDVVVENGVTLAAHHLGIAASVGAARLRVVAPPRVVVLTSGDEVRPYADSVEPHEIRNSNAVMLTALLRAMGARDVAHQHVRDDRDETVHVVGEALAGSELVMTVGGVSAGRRDWFPDAFDAHNVEPLVTGAAIQPGKPIRVGYVRDNHPVVALPGNPVSALACAQLFVWPILRRLAGKAADLPWRTVTLAEPVMPNPKRQAFRPARLVSDNQAVVLRWAGSGDLVHTATSDGLLALPAHDEQIGEGATLDFLPWAGFTAGH